MIVFVQRTIVIMLNIFLVFLLICINKQKKRNEMKETMKENVINKQGGTLLEYEIIHMKKGTITTGVIEEYPCRIGRSEVCDIVVENQEISNEHFEILPLGDSFRLIRILKGNNQNLPLAKVDGSEKIKRAATFDFRKSIEVPLAEQMVLHLKMKESKTKKYLY